MASLFESYGTGWSGIAAEHPSGCSCAGEPSQGDDAMCVISRGVRMPECQGLNGGARMTGSGRQAGIAKVRGPLPKVMLATAFAVTAALGAIMTGPISAEGGTTGSVSSFGSHLAYGSPAGDQLNARLTGMASTPDGKGYWLVAADGGIFNYGDAGFFGSDGGSVTFFPYVGIGATPSGHGYWVTNTFGTTEHFGDAADEGSLGTLGISPAAPMVGKSPQARRMRVHEYERDWT